MTVITHAQTDSMEHTFPLYFSAHFTHGKFLLAKQTQLNFEPTNAFGFELTAGTYFRTKSGWERLYNFPRGGFIAHYRNFNAPKIMGNSYALIPYIDFNYELAKNFYIDWTGGIGLGFLNKKFDNSLNNSNILIGSHVNVALYSRLYLKYEFGPYGIFAGGSISHFSNGKWNLPNRGINIFEYNVGVIFNPTEYNYKEHFDFSRKKEFVWNQGQGLNFNFQGLIGLKHAHVMDERFFPYYTGAISLSTPITNVFTPHIGLDANFDTSLRELNTTSKRDINDNFRLGTTIGFEMYFGKVTFFPQFGYYVFNQEKESNKHTFQNYFFRYYFYDNTVFFTGGLRANNGSADIIQFGFGAKL